MLRLMAICVAALVLIPTVVGHTAFNTVPPTRLDDVQVRNYAGNEALKAQDMAPPQCAPIRSSLQRIVYIDSDSAGSPSDQGELILGTSVRDTIHALGGNDCVLGGGGDDYICGGTLTVIRIGWEIEVFCDYTGGNDVLIGGPGTDAVSGGTGNDICYGESDPEFSCEAFYTPG